MTRGRILAILAVFSWQSYASASVCPVMLVSGRGDRNTMFVTFRNAGKLPIRQLEFNCTPVKALGKRASKPCREQNALFYPGQEYVLQYPYPGGVKQGITVSLKSATLSDGTVWKPSKRQACRSLKIAPGTKK